MPVAFPAKRPCPCCSGLRYGDCCAPLHRGAREASDAEALMRSRYCAFALRQVDYLWRTLHADHEDRHASAEVVTTAIRRACDTQRYPGLAILDRAGPDEAGLARVLFHARVFASGRDVSFVELSLFAHDGVGWRYLSGTSRPPPSADELRALTVASFSADS